MIQVYMLLCTCHAVMKQMYRTGPSFFLEDNLGYVLSLVGRGLHDLSNELVLMSYQQSVLRTFRDCFHASYRNKFNLRQQ